jgi:lysophospholipase L1-like esterase
MKRFSRIALASMLFVAFAAIANAQQAAKARAKAAPKAPSPVAAPADVASVMHPTGERHLRVIHDRFLKRIKDDPKIDLLFVGDSITWRWALAPDVWKAHYGKYDAANFGDGGAYTQHVLWRLENGELEGIRPKVVVLLVGINNLYHSPANTPEQTAAGIKKILDTIHEKLPQTKVLLLGIFPYRAKDSGPRKAAAAVNAIISKFDDGNKTRYLGLWDQFLQPDASISKEVMNDGLHPTPKGYEIWATNMEPLLQEMMK